MKMLDDMVRGINSVAIIGHVNPDGDCTGSCLAAYNYLKKWYPEIRAKVYLGDFSDRFLFLQGADQISHDFADVGEYELCLSIDASDLGRLGEGVNFFERAKKTVCIDHHITNIGFADENYIDGRASAACELLFTMMDSEKIDLAIAECLYMGIVHDTGVFKHSNTTEQTMTIAGKLVAKGVNTSYIIDETFYRKTYVQNRLLGLALTRSCLSEDAECIYTWLNQEDMRTLGAKRKDTDGIIDQLRLTEGIECALLLIEQEQGGYKVSMRANSWLNVSEICRNHGGGGHAKAAGCEIMDTVENIVPMILAEIRAQRDAKH
ncbi:MAG: DHH family phosphoesterase [Lachnospiraceae bacterium]|nr:DHH family phosphoesterase [Lachnospiraceae bacterium]